MSFSGIFHIDDDISQVSQPVSRLPIHPTTTTTKTTKTTKTRELPPKLRVPYRPPNYLSPLSPLPPPSTTTHAPTALPVSDARTRRWVTAHALSPLSAPSTSSSTVDAETSVFSDDSDIESDEDDSDIVSDIADSPSYSSESDDDESAIFMTRNPSHLRLRSTGPSTASLVRPPSPPRGRPAARARRFTTGLLPITPPSAAPVILDRSRARGLSSGAAAPKLPQQQQHHPRPSPSFSSLVAPSLTTDDSDESTTPSVSDSIPIPSALSRGRCRPSRFEDDSEDERWWMPSPPDAARKERERATGCGAFWDGWMRTANYA